MRIAAARHLGGAYFPDETAKGYGLTSVEQAVVDGRPVARLTFLNKAKSDCFDLIEFVPAEGKSIANGWEQIVASKSVSASPLPTDTLVLSRKKGLDVVFLAGSFSSGTANRLVSRLVWQPGD